MSKMRPELKDGSAAPGTYTPEGGSAYLMVYNAIMTKQGLIRGQLHSQGESCAIGSFFDVNPKCALHQSFIEEVAAMNDSFKHATRKQRRTQMLRWLRWKLTACGMPGFQTKRKPR